jgi:hypothetical protein
MIERYDETTGGGLTPHHPAVYQAAKMARILEDKLRLNYIELEISDWLIRIDPIVYTVESGMERGTMWGIPYLIINGEAMYGSGNIEVQAVIG